MGKITLIITVLILILLGVFLYIKNNIQSNITGKFNDVKVSNLQDFFVPKVDLDVSFDIINASKFNIKINDFKVKIYDTLTNEYLTENTVEKELIIPIGTSTHNVLLKDNEVLGNASNFLNGNVKFLAIISFRFYGIKIEFEQILSL